MISIKGLNKFFNKGKQNEIHVINDISLDLPERGMTAVFGKSGCGKTTLLNVIGGLDGFSSGSLTIEGHSITRNSDEIRNKYIGYIFQNYYLNQNESCFDNVAAALRLCGMKDDDEIERRVMLALKNVGMEKYARRTPDTLSGGQQQRIAIARAIVKNPPVILADEPTGNLDEANTVMIMDLLREIAKHHLVLLVTHEQNLVDAYCDRIIELSDGKIVAVREGSAEGIDRRNKQDIYLGELDQSNTQNEHINLEYYGEKPSKPIDIKIVNKEGRIYLKLDDDRIKIIDGTGEIKLIDGVYTENKEDKKTFEMTELPSIEGSNYGRLFSIKSSLISAYKQQQTAKRRGNKALRRVLLLFAIVIVFMSSVFGSSIGKLMDVENEYNHNTFYLYTENGDTDILASVLNSSESGIDYYAVHPYYPSGDSMFTFRLASFETFSQSGYSTGLQSHGVILDESLAEGYDLLAGKSELPSEEYILISDKVADDLIETANLGFVDEYSDLIGMTCDYYSISGRRLRVGGVIRSGEHAIYLDKLAVAKGSMESSGIVRVELASDFGIKLNAGEAVLAITNDSLLNTAPKVGETTMVQGLSLKVADIVSRHPGYDSWLNANVDKPSREEYFASILPDGADIASYTDEHYFEYDAFYYDSIDAYLKESYILDVYNFELWLYAVKGIEEVKNLYLSSELYGAEQYKLMHGRYPTKTEYDAIYESLPSIDGSNLAEYYELYNWEYDATYKNSINMTTALVSEEDFITISKSIGTTDSMFTNIHGSFIYLQIHSNNPEVTEAFLNEKFGGREYEYYDSIITPGEVRESVISYEEEEVVGYIVALIATLAIMSVCMYFIMRASIMSRIREIGIYRAIGVSKGNVVLRFTIEAMLLASNTVFLGYLLSSLFIRLLEYTSPNASEILFYPIWYALIVLLVLCGLTVFCGIIPILTLLWRTPSEILAKYDV